MRKEDLELMHNNFVLASGGTLTTKTKKEKKEKGDTVDTTMMFVLQGKPISAIAKERGLTAMTIYGHIEKLVANKRLSYEDIAYLVDDKTRRGFADIKAVFTSYDTTKLAPIHQHYKGRYTYDQIRIARMMIVLGYPQ